MSEYLKVCEVYSRRIGNEVGFLGEIIKRGEVSFMNSAVPKYRKSVSDMNDQAITSAFRMQIVYLVNLFESFMHDYISYKDGLEESDMSSDSFWNDYLCEIIKKWNIHCEKQIVAINRSTSFMNIRFSLFVLNEKYNLRFPSNLTPTIPELGSLRNCLVHHEGKLLVKDKGGQLFKETLSETLRFLDITETSKQITNLGVNDFVNKVIFDLQDFVALAGGRLHRKMEYND